MINGKFTESVSDCLIHPYSIDGIYDSGGSFNDRRASNQKVSNAATTAGYIFVKIVEVRELT